MSTEEQKIQETMERLGLEGPEAKDALTDLWDAAIEYNEQMRLLQE